MVGKVNLKEQMVKLEQDLFIDLKIKRTKYEKLLKITKYFGEDDEIASLEGFIDRAFSYIKELEEMEKKKKKTPNLPGGIIKSGFTIPGRLQHTIYIIDTCLKLTNLELEQENEPDFSNLKKNRENDQERFKYAMDMFEDHLIDYLQEFKDDIINGLWEGD